MRCRASWKARRELAAALRPIYTAVNAEAAREALEDFVTGAWGRALWALVGILLAMSVWEVLPGRLGYWLDLGLIMFGLYLIGCTIGSWARARVVARSMPKA